MRSPSPQPSSKRSGNVLIVGVGALGCPALALLSRSPVAKLTFIDPDRVEASNLPPQLLYDAGDIGRLKVQAAAARLASCGPELEPIADRLREDNAPELLARHDFVLDCCDDPATKFLINRTAVRLKRPFCYAGLSRTGGLCLTVEPGVSACLACVFPDGVNGETGRSRDDGCHETGIIAPVAGALGSYQALQALGALGHGEPYGTGRLAIYQLRGRRWQFVGFARDPHCSVCRIAQTEDSRRINSCRS